MKSAPHRQIFVTVNAPIDEGVACLVRALSQIPSLCTISSCQGAAFVTFRFGRTLQEQANFFCWLSLQVVGIGSLTAEWGGRDSLIFTLTCHPHAVNSLCDRIGRGLLLLKDPRHRRAALCGNPRTKSRNSRELASRHALHGLCGEPDILARQMLRAVLS